MKRAALVLAVAVVAFAAGYVAGSRRSESVLVPPADLIGVAEEVSPVGVVLEADVGRNLHTINLGRGDGVTVGSRFIVSRGNHYVSQIQIVELDAKTAVGSTVRGMSTGDVQQGDTVTLHAKPGAH
jgi:hypothetical protein